MLRSALDIGYSMLLLLLSVVLLLLLLLLLLFANAARSLVLVHIQYIHTFARVFPFDFIPYPFWLEGTSRAV